MIYYKIFLALVITTMFSSSSFCQTIWIQLNIKSELLRGMYNLDSLEKSFLKTFVEVTNQRHSKEFGYTKDFKIIPSKDTLPMNEFSYQIFLEDTLISDYKLLKARCILSEVDRFLTGGQVFAKKTDKENNFQNFLTVFSDEGGQLFNVLNTGLYISDIFSKDRVFNYNLDAFQRDSLNIYPTRFKNVLFILDIDKEVLLEDSNIFQNMIKNKVGKAQKSILRKNACFNAYFTTKQELKQTRERYPESVEFYCTLNVLGNNKYRLSQEVFFYRNHEFIKGEKHGENVKKDVQFTKYPTLSLEVFSFYSDLKKIFDLKP
ncbi:MAG: hypothetical protein HC912_02025 [Saprospiraceae bacterium]|nr:hypothetical protein [Saprospiraceae bacterium]